MIKFDHFSPPFCYLTGFECSLLLFRFISLFCTFEWSFHMIMCICFSVPFRMFLSFCLFISVFWREKWTNHFRFDCFRSSSFQISLKFYYTPLRHWCVKIVIIAVAAAAAAIEILYNLRKKTEISYIYQFYMSKFCFSIKLSVSCFHSTHSSTRPPTERS